MAFFFVLACSDSYPEVSRPSRDDSADRKIFNADIEFTRKGNPAGRLRAGRLLFFDKEHRTFGYDISVDFFDREGLHAAKLTADSGWVDNKSKRVTVYGNVYLVTDDETRLWTDSLAYYPSIDRIKTKAHVRIDRAGEQLSGDGLDSDTELADFRITQNVSGRLKGN